MKEKIYLMYLKFIKFYFQSKHFFYCLVNVFKVRVKKKNLLTICTKSYRLK